MATRATYPLYEIYLPHLEIFSGWQEYAAKTGIRDKTKNIYNPNNKLKYWRDMTSTNKRVHLYENVLAVDSQGIPVPGPDGRPYFEPMTMTVEEAQKVNMALWDADDPAWQPVLGGPPVTLPVPCRSLYDYEQLEFANSPMGGQIVMVRDTRVQTEPHVEVGFSRADRDLLQRIAAKLGA
jgi:hypothetical protein